MTHVFDQDAFKAGVELVGRAGAKNFEVGYLHDEVPLEEADWYAHAQFEGTRIIEEHYRGPVEAVEALARRLLTGGLCRRCGKPISLADTTEGCRWTRQGSRWEPGCDKPIDHSISSRPR